MTRTGQRITVTSKLAFEGPRVTVAVAEAIDTESNLLGVECHGLMRTLQYADQYESPYMRPDVEPRIVTGERSACDRRHTCRGSW